MSPRARVVTILVFISAVVAVYSFTPAGSYLSPQGFAQLRDWIAALGFWGPVAYIFVYAGAAILCIPGSILTVAAGAIFGTGPGFVYVFVAANLGSNVAFLISRYLGHAIVLKLLRGRLPHLEGGLQRRGFDWVVGLRLFPGMPYFAFNYLCGLSPVGWKDYFWGTLIGMIPGTFAFVSLGAALGTAASGVSLWNREVWTRFAVWGPFALILALILLAKLRSHRQNKKKATGNKADGP